MATGAASIPHPLIWLHYRLFGPSKLWGYAAVWTVLLVGGTAGFRQLFRDQPAASFYDAELVVLTGLQFIILVAGGCSAIHRALVRDTTTRMLESHRVSPLRGFTVLTGYLFGPNLHLLVLFLLNVWFGSFVIMWGTKGVDTWLIGNVFLLAVVLLPWSATVLIGIGRQKPINPVGVLLVLFITSPLMGLSPGLGVFTGFLAHGAAGMLMVGDSRVGAGDALGLLVINTVVTAIWGRAAIRKYLRPDLPAFDTLRALGLMFVWWLASAAVIVAQVLARDRNLTAFGEQIADLPLVCSGTSALSMLVALIPIIAVAHARTAAHPPATRRRGHVRLPPVFVPLICAILIVTFAFIYNAGRQPSAVVGLAVVIVACLTTAEALATRAYAVGKQPLMVLVLYVCLLWAAPVVLDAGYREGVAGVAWERPAPGPTVVRGLSPVGVMMEVFEPEGANVIPGVVLHALLAIVLCVLVYPRQRRRLKQGRART